MTASINGTTGVTFPDASVQGTAATGFGFKNRILNGNMAIDQRNAGANVNNSAGYTFGVDRWQFYGSSSAKYSFQQSTDAPVGFTTSTKITSLAATTVGSTDIYMFRQQIEGYNVADFNLGTANAATFTVSFYVKSSLTGTFGGSLSSKDTVRSYPFTYTISAANTWERKTVTVSGDTSGTWQTTNDSGLQLWLGLGVGSTYSGTAGSWSTNTYWSATGATSVVSTNGATFYITGVQLEKGSTATSFDYRPYGTELALCQRYYWKNKPDNLYAHIAQGRSESTYVSLIIIYPQIMRAAPTFSYSDLIAAGGTVGSVVASYPGKQTALYQVGVTSGPTVGSVNAVMQGNPGVGYLDASAEL